MRLQEHTHTMIETITNTPNLVAIAITLEDGTVELLTVHRPEPEHTS